MNRHIVNQRLLSDYYPGIAGFLLSFSACIGVFAGYNNISHADSLASTHLTLSQPTPTLVNNLKSSVHQPKHNPELQEQKKIKRLQSGKSVYVEATAYCLNNVTASGIRSKYGILAADPHILPIGSVVKLHADEYTGLYTVLDTGNKIKGRKIDIYLTDYSEAIKFGRRRVKVEVLRYGWNPQSINFSLD